MKRRANQYTRSAYHFLNCHFDRTVVITLVAVFLISWVKYKSERFECLNGDCIQTTKGEFFSLNECKRNCDVVFEVDGITDSKAQPENRLSVGSVFDTENSSIWGDTMGQGNVYYAHAIR